jgi:hypothetical protein
MCLAFYLNGKMDFQEFKKNYFGYDTFFNVYQQFF